MKDFDKYFDEIIGTLQITRVERERYKESLKNSITRWRIKGLLGKDEIPDTGGKLIWDWKMSQDKDMVVQMVNSVSKRIFNYRRKIFGLKIWSTEKIKVKKKIRKRKKD